MAVNKVIVNGTTRIDLTGDTVDVAHLISGYTAHDASGAKITGTLVPGITPTGTRTVTDNGTYDVTNYANCTVAIPEYDGSTDSFYTMCDYIESNGTQWIDTGWVHSSDSVIELDCNIADSTRDSWIAVFGSMNPNASTNAWTFFSRFGSNNIPALARTGNEGQGSGLVYNTRIKLISCGKGASWTTGATTDMVTSSGTANGGVATMALFTNHEGSNFNRHCVMKLYGAKFYTGGALQRDFVPAQNSSGIYGLYDRVNGGFYKSIGSGNFTGA